MRYLPHVMLAEVGPVMVTKGEARPDGAVRGGERGWSVTHDHVYMTVTVYHKEMFTKVYTII